MEYEIYWNNLNKETQKELLELMGDNGNYDVVPIATIPVKMEQEELTALYEKSVPEAVREYLERKSTPVRERPRRTRKEALPVERGGND